MRSQHRRNERGEMGSEFVYILIAGMVIASTAGVFIVGWIRHTPMYTMLWSAVETVAVLLVSVAVLVGLAAAAAARTARANRRTRHAMGPKLAEWLGQPDKDVHDVDLVAWRRAKRSGPSITQAQHWSDHGIPYATAAAALRRGITLDQVKDIDTALEAGGLWDGTDRAGYDELVTRHTSSIADGRGRVVLHRWLRFSPDEITAATTRRLSLPDVEAAAAADARWRTKIGGRDFAYPGPMWRRTGFAVDVLKVLEHPDAWAGVQQAATERPELWQGVSHRLTGDTTDDTDLAGFSCYRLVMAPFGATPIYCSPECEKAAGGRRGVPAAAKERVEYLRDLLQRSKHWVAAFGRGDRGHLGAQAGRS